MKLSEAFKAYESWVTKSKSALTAKVYITDVKNFIKFVGSDKDSSQITALDISGFQDVLQKKGWNLRSINRVGYALISFLEAVGRGDIARLTPTPVYEAKVPEWLPEEKVLKVIQCAGRPLDRALLSVGYELAMRRGELPLLDLEWFDRKNKTMKVVRLKHRGASSEYVLPMRDWAVQELEEYLCWRKDDTPPLFVTRYKKKWKRLHKNTVLKIYRRVAKKARVTVPFHSFTKHSRLTNYAISMIEKHGQTDITKLAKFAGHKNPASTLIYTHLASTHLIEDGS